MQVKDKINDIMRCQGYTIYSLSKATGLSQTSIANWFNSVNNDPSIQALEKVCEVFGITMAELFAGENDVMLPCKPDFKELFHKWQRLTNLQRQTINIVIDSYLYTKPKKMQ